MKTIFPYLAGLLLLLTACSKDDTVPVPTQGPSSVISQTRPLNALSQNVMEGVYKVVDGSGYFGNQVILKWNPKGVLIANQNGKHFILQCGRLDSVIFLQGYWRDGYSDATGLASLYIAATEGGEAIVGGYASGGIIIRGAYGENGGLPDKAFTLQYDRPFSTAAKSTDYYILAHRAGGRTSDRLPVSENCIAMVNFTQTLGTTGIEIDVRLTTDGVPFIYHDDDINVRLTQKGPLTGLIEDFSWFEISSFIRLIHGEKIPTLEEILTYTIDSTQMRFVYLDMKSASAIPATVAVQKKMMQRAQEKGRDILIVVGIPSTDVLNAVKALPDYQNIPTLCELTVDDVQTLNSRVWAPRWTLGTQNDLVQQVQGEGRLAVCWTIDGPEWIRTFTSDGHFNGLLTNFPYVEAYYHYTR